MEFVAARSVDEALAYLADVGDEAQVLAGGTDVMIQHRLGQLDPSAFVYIGGLRELEGFTSNGTDTFGALTTHWTVATDPTIRAAYPALAEAAATVGGWQTQQVGTLGGNVCNASPAADTVPALLVADAELQLRSAGGERRVPLDEFLLGRRSTARLPDEIVSSILTTPIGARTGETYLKLGRRSAMEVAIVGLAVRLTFDSAGTVVAARIAACSVGPRPYRGREAEQILEGSRLESDAVAAAGQALVDSATPIDDVRASSSYRLRVLPKMLSRAVDECHARAGGL